MRVSVADFRIGAEENKAVADVMASNRITEGHETRKFEDEFAQFIGTKFCLALSSGTAALICGLTALVYDDRFPGIARGSRVIVSPVTYISTVNAIILAGLEPVFVDIDPATFTLLPDLVEKAFRENDGVSLILPVHLMGYPNDMDALSSIARAHQAEIFEDSAQAHGSLYKGKKTGTFSIFADYSFYVAHNIQVGEMGALVTDDEVLWKLAKQVKTNGRICDCRECVRLRGACPHKDEDFDPRFTHNVIGYNFKTMDLLAALARTQLKRVDWILKKRQDNVAALNRLLEKYSDRLQLPVYSKDVSYLAYPVVIKDDRINRKDLMRSIEEKGVETRPLFGCIPTQQTAYAYLRERYKGRLPNAERAGGRGFYIGCHQYLSEADLRFIADVFEEALNG